MNWFAVTNFLDQALATPVFFYYNDRYMGNTNLWRKYLRQILAQVKRWLRVVRNENVSEME